MACSIQLSTTKPPGYERLLDYSNNRLRDKFHCCSTLTPGLETFGSSDPYFGGTLLLKFMADAFGEEIHLDLLRSEKATFDKALADELELRGLTISEAFTSFQRWFEKNGRVGMAEEKWTILRRWRPSP